MDFGLIYMRNGAVSQAMMGLGCIVFLFFILIPYVACLLFVPLYLTLLFLGADGKIKTKSPALTFLMPLAPFAIAGILCLLFWWAIPFLVNMVDMMFVAFKSIFVSNDSISLARKDIPDGKCYLYFIIVFGGSIGSLLSIMGISELWRYVKVNDKSIAQVREKEKRKEDYAIHIIEDIKGKALNSSISAEDANAQISCFLKKCKKKLNLSQETIQRLYDEYAIKESSNIGQMVHPFRVDYKNGKLTIKEANDMIKATIAAWAKDGNYSIYKANEIYERLKIKPTKG